MYGDGFPVGGERLVILAVIPVQDAQFPQRVGFRVGGIRGACQFECVAGRRHGLGIVAGVRAGRAEVEQGQTQCALVTRLLPVVDGVPLHPVGVHPVAFGVQELRQCVTQ